MLLKIGAKLPHSGALPSRIGIGPMAAELEAAGFDSIWVSDHVVFPTEVRSRYPFSSDGRITWAVDADYLEPIVVLSAAAQATHRAELGTAVLILPMRNPVLLAKQAATIDAMSGGRLVLGVGVGWLREEFEALGADFDARGAVLDEWLEIVRRCWTGHVEPFAGRFYRIPFAVESRPTPRRHVPLLIGGMSAAAHRRAAAVGGWIGQFSIDDVDPQRIAEAVEAIRGKSPDRKEPMRIVARVSGIGPRTQRLLSMLGELAGAGATEIVVDVDWNESEGPARTYESLRAAVA